MGMKFLSFKALPKCERQCSTQSAVTSDSTCQETSVNVQALEEQCARLQMENRRLRQITIRIAKKIGVITSHHESRERKLSDASHNSSFDDDEDGPAPHIILAQAHRLQKLNEMVVALSLAPRVVDSYKIVAEYTREIVGAARVSISILGSFQHDHLIPGPTEGEDGLFHYSEDDYLELFGLDGNEGALPLGKQLPIGNSQIGYVAKTRRPVRVMDCGNCEYDWVDIQHLHEMGMTACVDVPLISSGKMLGTLNTGVTDAAVYFPEVEQMLLQIAAVLANAMEKERLLLAAQNAYEESKSGVLRFDCKR